MILTHSMKLILGFLCDLFKS